MLAVQHAAATEYHTFMQAAQSANRGISCGLVRVKSPQATVPSSLLDLCYGVRYYELLTCIQPLTTLSGPSEFNSTAGTMQVRYAHFTFTSLFTLTSLLRGCYMCRDALRRLTFKLCFISVCSSTLCSTSTFVSLSVSSTNSHQYLEKHLIDR